MELIKLFPGDAEMDDFAKIPLELFPDRPALHFESIKLNREFLKYAYILKNGDRTLGGLAFYANPGHYFNGESACCVGYFHCIEDQQAVRILIDAVRKDAQALGFKYIIGPLNGTTWENYRFRTSETPPTFFLESDHPVYYNDLFTASGFYEIKTYYSFLVEPLRSMSQRALEREKQLIEAGITFRNINPEKKEEDLRKIYELCLISFKENFLYTPYSWEAFGTKYQLLDGLAKPHMTVIAEHDNKVVGFAFMIDDFLCSTQKRFVFKTYAVHPGARYSGLGAVISQRLIQKLMEQGYTSSIHAFVIEGSPSFYASSKDAEIYRTYKLYALDVG